jgi:hypothetical protein
VKRKRNGRQVGLPSPAALSPVVLCLSPVGIYYTRRKKPRKKKKKHPPTLPLFFLPVLLHLPQFLSFWMFWLGSPRKRFFQLRHLLLHSPAVVLLPEAKLLCVSIPSSSLPSSSFPSFLYLSSSSLNQDGGAYIYLAKAIHRVSAGNQQLKREREGRESRAQEL